MFQATRTGELTIELTDMEHIYDFGAKMIDTLSKEKILGDDVTIINKMT